MPASSRADAGVLQIERLKTKNGPVSDPPRASHRRRRSGPDQLSHAHPGATVSAARRTGRRATTPTRARPGPNPAAGLRPRRHPSHRTTRASRAATRRTDRHHRTRGKRIAGLRRSRPDLDQPDPPHQHQTPGPLQGLRCQPKPQYWLGTGTPQLEPNRNRSSGLRQGRQAGPPDRPPDKRRRAIPPRH